MPAPKHSVKQWRPAVSVIGLCLCAALFSMRVMQVPLASLMYTESTGMVQILPELPEERVVRSGEHITVEAIFHSTHQAALPNAEWTWVGNVHDALCPPGPTCTVKAPDAIGSKRIQAQVGNAISTHTILVVPAHTAHTAAARLEQRGILSQSLNSNQLLTQGELVTMLVRTLAQYDLLPALPVCEVLTEAVPEDHFAFISVCQLDALGVIDGSLFDPAAPALRSDVADMIAHTVGDELLEARGSSQGAVLSDGQVFTDVPRDDSHYYEIGVMNAVQLMRGNEGAFRPGDVVTKRDAVVVFDRVLVLLEMWE